MDSLKYSPCQSVYGWYDVVGTCSNSSCLLGDWKELLINCGRLSIWRRENFGGLNSMVEE